VRLDRPELGPLSPLVPRILVFAITELVAEEIRTGREDRLTELAPELVELIAKLLGGERQLARPTATAAGCSNSAG
jgi:hypothetical protein